VEREAPLGAGQLDTFFPYGIPSAALVAREGIPGLIQLFQNPKSESLTPKQTRRLKAQMTVTESYTTSLAMLFRSFFVIRISNLFRI
jgi:hypothetical protein